MIEDTQEILKSQSTAFLRHHFGEMRNKLASVAQSIVPPTGDQKVTDLIPAGSCNILFFYMDHEIISTVILSLLLNQEGSCQCLTKEYAYLLGKVYERQIYQNAVFVCVEVLRPSQPNWVMSSAVSLLNHTFTGQA